MSDNISGPPPARQGYANSLKKPSRQGPPGRRTVLDKMNASSQSYKPPRKKNTIIKDDQDDYSEDEETGNPKNTTGIFSDLKNNVAKNTRARLYAVKKKVSQQRGAMVRVIYQNFPGIGMRERMESHIGDAPPNPYTLEEATYPPLYPQLQASWLSVDSRKLAEDMHRLIHRVTVLRSGVNNVLLAPQPKESRQGVPSMAKAVVDLIKVVSKKLLDADQSELICQQMDEEYAKVDESTDMILFNESCLNHLEPDGKVIRLIRCVHQSLVLKPFGILRTWVIKNKMTKDVRTEDGWQIVITIAKEGFNSVKHVRKEQSMDVPTRNQPQKEKNHWEYEWEVSMTFDKDMNDMTSSRLSITNLILSQGMDPELQKELKDIMQNGNYNVF